MAKKSKKNRAFSLEKLLLGLRRLPREPKRAAFPLIWKPPGMAALLKMLRKSCLFSVCFLLTLVLAIRVLPTRSQEPTRLATSDDIVSPEQSATAEPWQLLDRGLGHYKEGRFLEAANLWERASDLYAGVYTNLGDRSTVLDGAQTLNYLALAYHRLGRGERAWESIENSLALLRNLEQLSPRGLAILAQTLNTRANLELARGQAEAALETWQQAETIYDRALDETGKLGSQINRAQALQSLGQYRKARSLLERVGEQLQARPDSKLKADCLRSLGVALQTVGDLTESKAILEQSRAISSRLNLLADTGATLFSIGNIARDLKQYDVALNYYREAQKLLSDRSATMQVQLNRLSLLVAAGRWEEASSLVPEIQSSLSDLSPSRSSVYARVNLAESLIEIGRRASGTDNISASKCSSYNGLCAIANSPEIAQLLAKAVQEARELGDARAEAESLNQLGNLYAQNWQIKEARTLTQQALDIAQRIDADRITASAAWQLGRLLKEEGDIAGAISAYQIAFDTLQSLRGDLVAINPEVQFNFKESVEPLYREFASLLLQPDASQADLKQARKTIEALQLAELDNFFRDACLDTQPALLDEIDTQAAVIYPIILSDRLEVILSLPNRPMRHYATRLLRERVEYTLQQLLSSLNPIYSNKIRLQLSQQVYDWLVRPVETDLEQSGIKTLVFIPDGLLRNLPMAALYDGDRYLLEKYSIAYSPGLQLFPQGLARQKLNVLIAGLTEARQGFSALPGVEIEISQIEKADFESETLLNPTFTRVGFQEKIDAKSFRVVHLATHGQFSSDPEKTFLLAWDDRIDVKDLDRLFQKRKSGLLEPIELLVMSACQTAVGDSRATLGLAGFALRSGARSTIASLWSVNDQATADLMSEFYSQLAQPDRQISKAEALRQAQLAVLNNRPYQHPYYWSAFILVGNWL